MFFKAEFLDRRFMVTGGALLLSLLLFIYFPENNRLSSDTQSLMALVVFFLLFPLLYTKYILKESWQALGFRLSDDYADWLAVAGMLILGLLGFFGMYTWWPELGQALQLPFSIVRSFASFVQYELFLLAIIFFYEVFFRGFVMLLFLRRFGAWSVVGQWLIFLLFLLAGGSFGIDQVPMMLFAPLAGWIAYRSRSLWYSFLASALFLFLIDAFLLLSNR